MERKEECSVKKGKFSNYQPRRHAPTKQPTILIVIRCYQLFVYYLSSSDPSGAEHPESVSHKSTLMLGRTQSRNIDRQPATIKFTFKGLKHDIPITERFMCATVCWRVEGLDLASLGSIGSARSALRLSPFKYARLQSLYVMCSYFTTPCSLNLGGARCLQSRFAT
jgi:hypothetical protein